MTISADYIKQVQAGLGVTNYEFAFILGVAKKTVEAWRGGWRSPQGSSEALIRIVGLIEKTGRATREDLLAKAGYQFDKNKL
jgi:DNA-binding transcriptional regulator YiaG